MAHPPLGPVQQNSKCHGKGFSLEAKFDAELREVGLVFGREGRQGKANLMGFQQPEAVHEKLDWHRIGFHEKVLKEMMVGAMNFGSSLKIVIVGQRGHVGNFFRNEVGGYADHTNGSTRDEGQGEVIVSGQNDEV